MSLLVRKRAATLEKDAKLHHAASTQINLPASTTAKVFEIGKKLIPDEVLAGEGRVEQLHVTLKYGVSEDEQALKTAIAGIGSFSVTLGKTEVFEPSESSGGASPVVVEVHGHQLARLHDAVMSAMGTQPDDFPYVPHITLAYVKPEEVQHFAGNDMFAGITFTAETVTLSKHDDANQVKVPLAKAMAQTAAELPLRLSAIWITAEGEILKGVSHGHIAAEQLGEKVPPKANQDTLLKIINQFGEKTGAVRGRILSDYIALGFFKQPNPKQIRVIAELMKSNGLRKAAWDLYYADQHWGMGSMGQLQREINSKTAAAAPAVTPEIPQVQPQPEEVERDEPAVKDFNPEDYPQEEEPEEKPQPEPKYQRPLPVPPKGWRAPKKPVPETTNFKKWFGKSKVVDAEGQPLKVYHGTTHEFDVFDAGGTTSESHYGKGLYFTDSTTDVAENYATEKGGDITGRIERRAEEIIGDWEHYWEDEHGDEPFPQWSSKEDSDYRQLWNKARAEAKSEVAGPHGGATMPVYLSIKNPVVVKQNGGTYLTMYDEDAFDEEGEMNTDYGGSKFWRALNAVADVWGLDGQTIWDDATRNDSTLANDEFTAWDFENAMRMVSDIEEPETGSPNPGWFIADVYKEMGFDGIIMDAWSEFGQRTKGQPMKMDYGTKHYIVWNPNQIKSAIGNVGKFDPKQPSITAAEKTASWQEQWDQEETLPAGTILYHGTNSTIEEGDDLNVPAWFSTLRKVAEHFAKDWHTGEGESVVRAYRVTNPITLPSILNNRDMDNFRANFGIEGSSIEDMAEDLMSMGVPGWIIPDNYRPGDDIMLTSLNDIQYMETHTAGKTATTERVIPVDDLPPKTQSDLAAQLAEHFNETGVQYPDEDRELGADDVRENLFGQVDPPTIKVYDAPVKALYKTMDRHNSAAAVEKYVEMLKNPSFEFDPIFVNNGRFSDGGHRLEAYYRAGRRTIPVAEIGPFLNAPAEFWRHWFEGDPNTKFAAGVDGTGDLTLANKIMNELYPMLGEPSLPKPGMKIVNQPRANWLGRDTWRVGIQNTQAHWGDNTTIDLQRSIVNDENTLRRIIAHELCHHADALINGAEGAKSIRDRWTYNSFLRDQRFAAHGKMWKQYAQKFNAKYGADFVTETSDQTYVTEEQELRPFNILLKRDPDGQLAYEVSSRLTAKAKRYLDRLASDKSETEHRITQTNDREFMNGHLIGSWYWVHSKEPETQQKLEELWSKGQKILPTGAAKEKNFDYDPEILALMRQHDKGKQQQRVSSWQLPPEVRRGIPSDEPIVLDVPLSAITVSRSAVQRTQRDIATGAPSQTEGPVRLFYDVDHNQILVEDGMHRLIEAFDRGDQSVRAELWSGYSDVIANVWSGQEFKLAAMPQLDELEHGVSKDYDRVRWVYQQFYDNRIQSMPWRDFQKKFQWAQNSPLFTQVRQNRPNITMEDMERWMEEYKAKAKEYQNYELEHSTYQNKDTSYRDVEQLVLRVNQSASAAETIGEDEMMKFFLKQVAQGSVHSKHPVSENTVGWLRVDFINDQWLLVDEIQSDLIDAVDLAKRWITEPTLDSLMNGYRNETVKQKIKDMGATEPMFQRSKREFIRHGYTIEKLDEMRQSLNNLFKDWAEYGIASLIEIARRNGIQNVAIHTGKTIAQRDPDLEADKAVMFYDQIAKSFGFKKQPVDVGDLKGEFWVRTASKIAGKRSEATTSLVVGLDDDELSRRRHPDFPFSSPILIRWEQGMRWREVLKVVKAIINKVAGHRIPWKDIMTWKSPWENYDEQQKGWEGAKAKGTRIMFDILHNGSFVSVGMPYQAEAVGMTDKEGDSHKVTPMMDTMFDEPEYGMETNAYADIPERMRGMYDVPSLGELAPDMFEKQAELPEEDVDRTEEQVAQIREEVKDAEYTFEIMDSHRGELFGEVGAYVHGKPVGFVKFSEFGDVYAEGLQEDDEVPRRIHVKYVYVAPMYRRMGIGTGMYRKIMQEFPGEKIIGSGTTERGGKFRKKLLERGVLSFKNALLKKKAAYAEGQNEVRHTDHEAIGMTKALKSDPFAGETELLALSLGKQPPEPNPMLVNDSPMPSTLPTAEGEEDVTMSRIGAGPVVIDWDKDTYKNFKLRAEYSWHENGDPTDEDEDIGENNWNMLVIDAFDITKKIKGSTLPGAFAGECEFVMRHGELQSSNTAVMEEYQRQGLATAMYSYAEEVTGFKTTPHSQQSPAGRALWRQKGRPFGG